MENSSIFAKSRDLFGVADLVALKPGRVMFVQVTCNNPHPHSFYLDWVEKYKVKLIQMVWYDRKGWLFYFYNDDRTYLKYDLRKKNKEVEQS